MEHLSGSTVFRVHIERADGRNAAKISIQKFVGHIPAVAQTESKTEMRSSCVKGNMFFSILYNQTARDALGRRMFKS